MVKISSEWLKYNVIYVLLFLDWFLLLKIDGGVLMNLLFFCLFDEIKCNCFIGEKVSL